MSTVSVPDSYVPNPAYNNGSDKLTHLGNDGADNSILGLEEAFGIEIDYYAKVNFQSLIHIVDALGGVEVDVKLDFTEQDENRSFKKKDLTTLKKESRSSTARKLWPMPATGKPKAMAPRDGKTPSRTSSGRS